MDLYLGWPWLSAEVCPPSPCGLSWSMYGWDKAPAAQTSQWLLGVHIMMLLICLSFLVCYVAVFGMLTEEMAAAHSWDWGIQSQNTLMSLLWLSTQSSSFWFSCPQWSVNNKHAGLLGIQALHLATNACIILTVKWKKVKETPWKCLSWESKAFPYVFPDQHHLPYAIAFSFQELFDMLKGIL